MEGSKAARQATVSRSTSEIEYVCAGEIAKELQCVHHLAPQFWLVPGCFPVGCDNNAAISLVENPITAHIDIIYHHVRQRVQMQPMRYCRVPTRENCANVKLQGYVHNMAQSAKHRQQQTRSKQTTKRPARKTLAEC
jgi:hypothetical protein